MAVKMSDRPDLFEKAKQLGFHVEPNTGTKWLGKYLLINPDGAVKYTDNTEELCWIQAMRYADMYINLVEKSAK